MDNLLSSANLGWLGHGIKAARTLIFPDQCPACGDLLADAGGLCGPCWRDTPFILGAVCDLCGGPVTGPEDDQAIHCDACRSLARPWRRGRAVMVYRGGARKLVLGLKHSDRLDLVPVLAQWMAPRAMPLLAEDTLLVPVPIHRRRLFKRKYNQAAALARAVATRLDRPCLPDALVRRRATAPLADGNYLDRKARLEGAIIPHPNRVGRIDGRSVLLVDDVMTTGATAAACALALCGAGAREVAVLTLARAPQHA